MPKKKKQPKLEKLSPESSVRTCIPVFVSSPRGFVKPKIEHFQDVVKAGVSEEVVSKLLFYYTLFLYFDIKSNSHLLASSYTEISGVVKEPITEHFEFTESNKHLIKEFTSVPSKIFFEHEIDVLKFNGKEMTFSEIDDLIKQWKQDASITPR